MRAGEGQFVTLPGQAFYDVGLKLKQEMKGPYKFIVGQGNDKISYILPPGDGARRLATKWVSLSGRRAGRQSRQRSRGRAATTLARLGTQYQAERYLVGWRTSDDRVCWVGVIG